MMMMMMMTIAGLSTTEQQLWQQDSNCIIEHKALARRAKYNQT